MRRKKRQHKITTAVHSIERALQSVFSSRAVTRIQRIWALLESTYILWLMASTEYRMSRGVFNVRTQIVGRHRVYYVQAAAVAKQKWQMGNGTGRKIAKWMSMHLRAHHHHHSRLRWWPKPLQLHSSSESSDRAAAGPKSNQTV